MANDNTGWITMFNDTVMKTTNFFQTFGKQYHPAFVPGEIYVIDTSYAFTAKAVFAKTTNGGGNFVSVNQISSNVPEDYNLGQNYPNPFNPVTSIEFSIPQNSNVSLIIYDVLGRETYTELSNKNLKAGAYNIKLDFNKANISSGVYFYKLTAINNTGIFTLTKKMIYVK